MICNVCKVKNGNEFFRTKGISFIDVCTQVVRFTLETFTYDNNYNLFLSHTHTHTHTVNKRSVADEASKLRDIVLKTKDITDTVK